MSILVELDPDEEDRLRRLAATRGLSLQDLVQSLLHQASSEVQSVERPPLDEFESDWAAFAEGLEDVPALPPEAFSREAMYGAAD